MIIMSRTQVKPIMDTRMNQADFKGGEVTELTTNVIAESIYAKCDVVRMRVYSLHLSIIEKITRPFP